jgi:biopolymer transport protein ExbD
VAFTARGGHTQTALAEINITPLVDVVLVLLVIFMLTAPVLQSGITVAVPKTYRPSPSSDRWSRSTASRKFSWTTRRST